MSNSLIQTWRVLVTCTNADGSDPESQELSWTDLVDANPDWSPMEIAVMAAELAQGQEVVLGGGAQPIWRIIRLFSQEPANDNR